MSASDGLRAIILAGFASFQMAACVPYSDARLEPAAQADASTLISSTENSGAGVAQPPTRHSSSVGTDVVADAGVGLPDAGAIASPADVPADSGSPSTGGVAVDAGGPSDAGGVDGGPQSGPADAGNNCIDAVAPSGSGHHNAGTECLACHGGAGAPKFTLAGTVYSTATGGAAVAGATVEVVDATGKTLRLPTANNGNFYTSSPVAYPAKVRASKCPADQPMIGAVNTGSCNGCHGPAMRVHLP